MELVDLFGLPIDSEEDYDQTIAVASFLADQEELTDRWRRVFWVLGDLIDIYEDQNGLAG